jgi:hypothetical protein
MKNTGTMQKLPVHYPDHATLLFFVGIASQRIDKTISKGSAWSRKRDLSPQREVYSPVHTFVRFFLHTNFFQRESFIEPCFGMMRIQIYRKA